MMYDGHTLDLPATRLPGLSLSKFDWFVAGLGAEPVDGFGERWHGPICTQMGCWRPALISCQVLRLAPARCADSVGSLARGIVCFQTPPPHAPPPPPPGSLEPIVAVQLGGHQRPRSACCHCVACTGCWSVPRMQKLSALSAPAPPPSWWEPRAIKGSLFLSL